MIWIENIFKSVAQIAVCSQDTFSSSSDRDLSPPHPQISAGRLAAQLSEAGACLPLLQ